MRSLVLSQTTTPRVLILTPPGTSEFIDLSRIGVPDGIDRNEYAHRLVRRRYPPGANAPLSGIALPGVADGRLGDQSLHNVALGPALPSPRLWVETVRSVLGDARDLLCHALRKHLATDHVVLEVRDTVTDLELLGYNLVVHVGPTPMALELLEDAADGLFDDGVNWDGNPATLDADGFIQACFPSTRGVANHLVLVGGSPYGTHHAVTELLHRYVGAAWLFPGLLGESIPVSQTHSLVLDPAPNEIAEPFVRSRTFAAMSRKNTPADLACTQRSDCHARPVTNGFSAEECDEIRTWQLRNRMRPYDDRYQVFYSFSDSEPMLEAFSLPERADRPYFAAMREFETRFSVTQGFSAHLSPFTSAFPALTTPWSPPPAFQDSSLRHHVEQMRSVYPDVRDRDLSMSASGPIDAAVGLLPREVTPFTITPIAEPAGAARCRSAFSTRSAPDEVDPCDGVLDRNVAFNVDDELRAAASQFVTTPHTAGVFCDYAPTQEVLNRTTMGAHVMAPRAYQRFIPSAVVRNHAGPRYPSGAWHPCIFADHPSTMPGRLAPVHERLLDDVAVQVWLAMAGRAARYQGDAGYSLAMDDGSNWCSCDACVRADSQLFLDNDLILLWGGTRYASGGYNIEISRLSAAIGTQSAAMVSGLRWNNDVTVNPFAHSLTGTDGPNLDELAWRGVIFSSGLRNKRTRRVLTLVNGVANRLRDVVQRAGDGDHPSWGPHRVIAFLAYLDYVSAPTFSAPPDSTSMPTDPQDPAFSEWVDPSAIPYIAMCSDLWEYDQAYVPEGPMGALQRMRSAPQQFAHERWSQIASHTGLYEYMFNSGYAVPRIYTRRLCNAISRGIEHFKLKGFVSETRPNWGLQGPMLWSVARALWPAGGEDRDPAALRRRFCDSAFGSRPEPTARPRTCSSLMDEYFELAERAWSDTRDGDTISGHDQRTAVDTAGGYYGQGYNGRQSMISQFEGLYRTDVDRDGNHGVRMELMWSLLHRAFHCFPSGDTSAERSRVQIYRRTFGLTVLIGRWYQPIHDAFEALREANRTGSGFGLVNGMSTPRNLVVTSGYDIVPPIDVPSFPTGVTIVSPSLSAEHIASLRVCFAGDAGGNRSLSWLRAGIHMYIANSNEVSREGTRVETGLGLGLAPGTTDGRLPFADITSEDTRLLAMHWIDMLRYITWWNNLAALDPEPRTVRIVTGLVGDDAYSIDQIFVAMKDIAKIVLLYCRGVTQGGRMETTNPLSLTILARAVMGG